MTGTKIRVAQADNQLYYVQVGTGDMDDNNSFNFLTQTGPFTLEAEAIQQSQRIFETFSELKKDEGPGKVKLV